jgi:hypothetical protein
LGVAPEEEPVAEVAPEAATATDPIVPAATAVDPVNVEDRSEEGGRRTQALHAIAALEHWVDAIHVARAKSGT